MCSAERQHSSTKIKVTQRPGVCGWPAPKNKRSMGSLHFLGETLWYVDRRAIRWPWQPLPVGAVTIVALGHWAVPLGYPPRGLRASTGCTAGSHYSTLQPQLQKHPAVLDCTANLLTVQRVTLGEGRQFRLVHGVCWLLSSSVLLSRVQ